MEMQIARDEARQAGARELHDIAEEGAPRPTSAEGVALSCGAIACVSSCTQSPAVPTGLS